MIRMTLDGGRCRGGHLPLGPRARGRSRASTNSALALCLSRPLPGEVAVVGGRAEANGAENCREGAGRLALRCMSSTEVPGWMLTHRVRMCLVPTKYPLPTSLVVQMQLSFPSHGSRHQICTAFPPPTPTYPVEPRSCPKNHADCPPWPPGQPDAGFAGQERASLPRLYQTASLSIKLPPATPSRPCQ